MDVEISHSSNSLSATLLKVTVNPQCGTQARVHSDSRNSNLNVTEVCVANIKAICILIKVPAARLRAGERSTL